MTRGVGFVEEDGGRPGFIPVGGGAESRHPLVEEQVPSLEGHLGSLVGFVPSRTKRKLRSTGEVRVWREAAQLEVVAFGVRQCRWASSGLASFCPDGGRQVPLCSRAQRPPLRVAGSSGLPPDLRRFGQRRPPAPRLAKGRFTSPPAASRGSWKSPKAQNSSGWRWREVDAPDSNTDFHWIQLSTRTTGYLNRVGQKWWLTLIAWPS